MPFLLTGDPYYLEEMQFWANENMLALPANSRFMVAGRYLAWPTRAIAEAYRARPRQCPTGYCPRATEKMARPVPGYIETRAGNQADPFMYLFHTVQEAGQDSDKDPVPSGDHVWQQNMLELVAAWLASWDADWVAPAEWLLQSAVARASATSGWARSHPSPISAHAARLGLGRRAARRCDEPDDASTRTALPPARRCSSATIRRRPR